MPNPLPIRQGGRGRRRDGVAKCLRCPESAAGPAVPPPLPRGCAGAGGGPQGWRTAQTPGVCCRMGGCTTPHRSSPAWQSSMRGLILPAQAPSAPARPRSRGWVGSRVTLPFPSRRGTRRGRCQPDRGGSRSPCQSTCVGPPAPARSRRAKPGSAPRARPPQPDVIPRPVPPGCGRSRAQGPRGHAVPRTRDVGHRSGGDGASRDPPAPVSALCPRG